MHYRLLAASVAFALLECTAGAVTSAERPNVVLIVADDLGWSDLGCYGSKFHRTPHLDVLASAGQRFTQAYAACPVCSPTRAALMTGQHPARLHLTDWLPGRRDMPSQLLRRPQFRQELPLDEVTLAERLKTAGYITAHIGKWHLGGAGYEPTRQGFDVNVAGDSNGSPASYFSPFKKGARVMPGLDGAPEGQYLTDRLTDEAIQFISAHPKEPFFLYLPHFAVHTPLAAKSDVQAHYPTWDGTPHGRQENPIYAAMLESLDEGVGRIMDKLKQLGLAERTIVVFTSDNGGLATLEGPHTPATNNAPLREGKGWLYEGGLRVPLIVCWPTHISPGISDVPVWSPDLPPTVMELIGSEPIATADGLSLAGLIMRDQTLPARDLYWHYPHYSNQGGRPGGAIRSGDWKLVEYYETGRRELFHLAKDLRESRNLVEEQPQRLEELSGKLAAWRKSVDSQMPTPNPDYVPNPQDKEGVIVMPARTAEVHGVMLRYEPLPHKNTLGFWVKAEDWAHWECEVFAPGDFRMVALVGCGKGSGGSKVEFRMADQTLSLTVPETGGFQQFVPQELGRITLARPGRLRLEVHPQSKPGPAVMDLREIKLVPVKN